LETDRDEVKSRDRYGWRETARKEGEKIDSAREKEKGGDYP
jgi:hypothetical protein